MEVCGGHTHAIHRHGLGTHLPPNVEYVHGPGCPVCVLPRGRLDDAVALARDHDVTLCSYGDVLRVPGTHGSLLEARSAGADIRIVYSPLDAVRLAQANPDREVVFFGIGFETTAPATAAAVTAAHRQGLSTFTVLCNLVRVVPPLAALLDDPATRLDGLIGPGHVSTIIGCAPYVELAERYRIPVVVAGFEPLDLLAATLAVVQQVREGRAEVENGYRRAVTWDGNAAALALLDDVFEVRDTFEWRGLGLIERSGYRIAERYGDHDAERRFDLPGIASPDPRACRCGDVLRGALRPGRVQGVRHRVHPRPPHRQLHGVVGGRLRRRVPVRPRCRKVARHPGPAPVVTGGAVGPVALVDGAGGAASRRLVAEHVVPRLAVDPDDPHRPLLDATPFTTSGTRLATTTDAHVVRPLRFPGGSIGSLAVHGTVNDLAVSGARPLVLTAAFVLEEGLPLATFDRELDAMAAAARAAGVRVVAGDTKVVERGRADGMYVVTSGVGRGGHRSRPRAHARPPPRRRPHPGERAHRRPRDRGAARPGGPRHRRRRPQRLRLGVALAEALIEAATAAAHLRVMRDPTRGGLATTLNELALDAELGIEVHEPDVPIRPATRGACELLGLDPWCVANEGCLVAVVAPEAADAALAALRAVGPTGALAARIGEVVAGPAGRVVSTTAFGGRRIVDLMAGDPLPRIC